MWYIQCTGLRRQNMRTLTCVLLHSYIDNAAMLSSLFVQLAIHRLDAGCTTVLLAIQVMQLCAHADRCVSDCRVWFTLWMGC